MNRPMDLKNEECQKKVLSVICAMIKKGRMQGVVILLEPRSTVSYAASTITNGWVLKTNVHDALKGSDAAHAEDPEAEAVFFVRRTAERARRDHPRAR